jgi:ligand-binding sensor domain-containing protein
VCKHDPQNLDNLGHNQVTALTEDHAGMLWIGTNGGGLEIWTERSWIGREQRRVFLCPLEVIF